MGQEMHKIWVPGRGMELHEEYPVPETAEIIAHWRSYTPGEVVEAPKVYGCLRLPDTPPRAYASIDVCEVLRETHRGLRTVAEVREEKYVGNIHRYGEGTPITSSEDITSVLQVLMTNALIEPVEGINEIGTILRKWRAQGVYVVANTSTLPGCEKGTIDFFKEYLSDAIDGILLPRNYDGSLPLTKGHAAAQVVTLLSPDRTNIAAVHIDDSPHHNIAFREQVQGLMEEGSVATFQPTYPSHLAVDTGSTLTSTPAEAFQAADRFLGTQLGFIS